MSQDGAYLFGGLILRPPTAPVFGMTRRHRKIAKVLLKLKLWEIGVQMRCHDVRPRAGWRWRLTGWLYDRMRRLQVLDDLHHAPACPANHWRRRRLVLKPCTCGAREVTGKTKPPLWGEK